MGFDEDCLTETGTVQSCAWFVFDDIYGWVNWRAVGANGTMSMNHSVQGQHGSGDSASVCTVWFQDRCLQWTRKKLLAWITSATERTQVKARLLDDAGNQIGSDLVLANAQPGRKFYQTAVAFSGNENRWLVVWTDAGTTTGQPVGHAFTTYVRFDGTASGTVNTVGPCDEYDKSAVETEAASRNGTRWNDYLACKGIWLASSWYSTTTDRYRFHNYGFHRRIDSNGTPAAQWSNLGCHVYCPMTEASFSYDGVPTTFQMLSNSVNMPDRSVHFRLRRDSYEKYDFNTTVMDYPWFIPQAFRSNAYVAAALSTDRDRWTTGNADLVLSIVDVRYDTLVCPPAP